MAFNHERNYGIARKLVGNSSKCIVEKETRASWATCQVLAHFCAATDRIAGGCSELGAFGILD